MGTVLTSFITTMTDALTTFAGGFGDGLQKMITEMFLVTSTSGEVTGLSTFGGVVAIFAGIGLTLGLSRLVFEWIRSIGN